MGKHDEQLMNHVFLYVLGCPISQGLDHAWLPRKTSLNIAQSIGANHHSIFGATGKIEAPEASQDIPMKGGCSVKLMGLNPPQLE